MINKNEFDKNPSQCLEHAIREFVATSPANHLAAFDNEHMFDEPLVGFADGDDSIFQDYKEIIGPFHQTPREALEMRAWEQGDITAKQPEHVSTISFIMPTSTKTKQSMRKESTVPSLRWNHTRWRGQAFIFTLSRYLVSLLNELGYRAVAPEVLHNFKIRELEKGYASNWSQRHIAYAAGLGTFSLSDGFITSKGIAMRCGSVVTDIKLTPSPRLYDNHMENCLFYHDGSCRRCIERCPEGAITELGHDRKKCRQFMHGKQVAEVDKDGGNQGYIGTYYGCGLCQAKVPCESGIPVKTKG